MPDYAGWLAAHRSGLIARRPARSGSPLLGRGMVLTTDPEGCLRIGNGLAPNISGAITAGRNSAARTPAGGGSDSRRSLAGGSGSIER